MALALQWEPHFKCTTFAIAFNSEKSAKFTVPVAWGDFEFEAEGSFMFLLIWNLDRGLWNDSGTSR